MSSKSLSFVLILILLASLPLSPTLAEEASSTALPVVEFRGDRWRLLAQWHDMFYGRRSAALAGLSYCF